MPRRLSDITRRLLRRAAKPTRNARLGIERLEDRVNPTPAITVASLGDVNETPAPSHSASPGPRPARLRPSTSRSAARRPPGSLQVGTTTTTGLRLTFPGRQHRPLQTRPCNCVQRHRHGEPNQSIDPRPPRPGAGPARSTPSARLNSATATDHRQRHAGHNRRLTSGDVNESAGSVTFRFTRTETGPPPTVNFTLGGTASAGQPPGGDYYHNGTSVTFPSGSTTVDKTMTVFNDSTMEPDESIVLTISAWGGSGPQYTVGTPNSAIAMIIDNDTTVVTVECDVEAKEGVTNGSFEFTRTGSTSQPLTVN